MFVTYARVLRTLDILCACEFSSGIIHNVVVMNVDTDFSAFFTWFESCSSEQYVIENVKQNVERLLSS